MMTKLGEHALHVLAKLAYEEGYTLQQIRLVQGRGMSLSAMKPIVAWHHVNTEFGPVAIVKELDA